MYLLSSHHYIYVHIEEVYNCNRYLLHHSSYKLSRLIGVNLVEVLKVTHFSKLVGKVTVIHNVFCGSKNLTSSEIKQLYVYDTQV